MQKDAPDKFHEKIFQEWKELEEQKSKEALELLGHKHKLGKLKMERERAKASSARQTASEGSGMESDCLTKSSPWQVMEKFRNWTIYERNVGVCYSQKSMGKKGIGGCCKRKARRNTRSVAAGVALQRSSGACQKECGYRLQCPNNALRVQGREVEQLGKLQRGISEKS